MTPHLTPHISHRTSPIYRYIRFIYNRVVLENATVRASAVSALAKFGIQNDYLRTSIIVLLQRCLYDNDDEVRDRATFFVALLKGMESGSGLGGLDARKLMLEPLPVPLSALEASCRAYMAAPDPEKHFSINDVTVDPELIEREKKAAAAKAKAAAVASGEEPASPAANPAVQQAQANEADLLSKLPQFVHLGARFTSSKRAALSEAGTEYEVGCIKHVYASHILLQFELNNTLEDQLLEGVSVEVDLSGVAGVELDSELPCAKLAFGSPASAYTCLRRTAGVPLGAMACKLKFLVKDVDPAKGEPEEEDQGYDDEYNLEELELAAADFMRKVAVADFRESWETMGNGCEKVETFSLTYNSLRQAMEAIIEFLGMQVCDNTGNPADGARTHAVLLSGVFLGGVQVFAIVNLRTDGGKSVGMRLTVRSTDMQVSSFVAASVA